MTSSLSERTTRREHRVEAENASDGALKRLGVPMLLAYVLDSGRLPPRQRVAQMAWRMDPKRMCRLIVVLCAHAALIAAQCNLALARPGEVWIWSRTGGYLFLYIIQGKQMISTGNSYRVRGDQYSAAAIQVLFIEKRDPDRICASPLAKLHFHQPFNPITKTPVKNARRWLVAFIGRANLKRLGPLPEVGQTPKTVRATDYVGRCKTKAIACNVMYCGW
jgi:hypothetical protein